jgi:hypothetical protein
MKKVQKYGVDNLHYLAVNANVDYERIAKYLNEKSKIIRGELVTIPSLYIHLCTFSCRSDCL